MKPKQKRIRAIFNKDMVVMTRTMGNTQKTSGRHNFAMQGRSSIDSGGQSSTKSKGRRDIMLSQIYQFRRENEECRNKIALLEN